MATRFIWAPGLLDNSRIASTGSDTWANRIKPTGVYHNNGVATESQSVAPPNKPTNNANVFTSGRTAMAGGATTQCYGIGSGFSAVSAPTWSTYNTAKAYQLGLKRSTYSIGEEIYLTFDIAWGGLTGADLVGYEPTETYKCLFKWGDLEVRFKSSTYNSGTAQHEQIWSVRNNGSEVATVTVPGVTNSTWHFVKIHAKLHATTGLIDVTIDGHAQSVAYTNQNTIATTSLVSAAYIYFSPPVADNNADTAYIGYICNVWLSDSAFPGGRPHIFTLSLSSDVTLTGWAAEGTSATTVVNALSSQTDAKAARGSGVGSSALLSITAHGISGLNSTIHGLWIECQRISNRDLTAAKKLSVGFSLSGVHNMGSTVSAIVPPKDTQATPPAVMYVHGEEQFLSPSYTQSDLANLRVRLLVEAA